MTIQVEKLESGQTRIFASEKSFPHIKRTLIGSGVFVIQGSDSIFVPSLSLKFLRRIRCKTWPDISGRERLMLASEAARTELKREFPELKKIGWRGVEKKLFTKLWPMFFRQGGTFWGIHIDLKGAYWQIYRNLWLDTRYPCGIGKLPLRSIASRLSGWKTARNSLVGITVSRNTRAFKNGFPITLHPDNPFLTPHLWANVQETLNSIAKMAWYCGAVYCMTDGYVFKSYPDAKVFLDWLDDFGVDYRMNTGVCKIRGWGSYSLPHKTTKAYKRNSSGGGPFTKISLDTEDVNKLPNFVFNICRRYNDELEREGKL